jgi:hypothetical protein
VSANGLIEKLSEGLGGDGPLVDTIEPLAERCAGDVLREAEAAGGPPIGGGGIATPPIVGATMEAKNSASRALATCEVVNYPTSITDGLGKDQQDLPQ